MLINRSCVHITSSLDFHNCLTLIYIDLITKTVELSTTLRETLQGIIAYPALHSKCYVCKNGQVIILVHTGPIVQYFII